MTNNGYKWLSNMTQTLVALLLLSAVSGSIWTALEVRSLSAKLDAINMRVDRNESWLEGHSARIRALEQGSPADVSLWGMR